MKRHILAFVIGVCLLLSLGLSQVLVVAADPMPADWPQAAGPNHNFVARGEAAESFSVATGRGVAWRSSLPNTGQGSVVVSNGRVFVCSHASTDGDAEMGSTIVGQCFDAETGKELWRKQLPGTRETDLSSLFSDNTAASPVADGKRVCFVNVGGSIACFDYDGNELWSHHWVPFGRHHSRQHEPILHDGKVIILRVVPSDLDPSVTTKVGAKPLGRDLAYWTRLHAYDMQTGQLEWTGQPGTGVHATSILGQRNESDWAVLTGRGGGHQPPEEPYGLSLVDAVTGKTIWEQAIKGYPSAQNCCWNEELAALFAGKNHQTVDMKSGQVAQTVSLNEDVQMCRHVDDGYELRTDQEFKRLKKAITNQSNLLVGDYHYFRSHEDYFIGRVNVGTGRVEYLEVPVQVIRKKGHPVETRWQDPLVNDMRNAAGHLATQDRRNAGSGWGHVSAASPTVIGDLLYMPAMNGMVYVVRWNAPVLDETALVSVSDLGPAGETWTLSTLSFSDGKIYTRTMKELICIGNQ